MRIKGHKCWITGTAKVPTIKVPVFVSLSGPCNNAVVILCDGEITKKQ